MICRQLPADACHIRSPFRCRQFIGYADFLHFHFADAAFAYAADISRAALQKRLYYFITPPLMLFAMLRDMSIAPLRFHEAVIFALCRHTTDVTDFHRFSHQPTDHTISSFLHAPRLEKGDRRGGGMEGREGR